MTYPNALSRWLDEATADDLPPDWRVVLDQVRALPAPWQALALDVLKTLLLWAAWFTRQPPE